MRRLALLALLATVAACGGDPAGLPAVGTLERDRIELVAESNEPIVEIPVHEGERVEAGALLVRLDDARLRAQVATAAGARDQASARLAELQRGPRAERIEEARARLAGAESAVATAKLDLDRARALAKQNFESRARLDSLQGAFEQALARRKEARAALDEALQGTTLEELAQARGALAAAEAALVDAQLRLERLLVRAPQRARVDALPFEPGERPPAGAVVVVLLADSAPYARVHLPEALRVRVSPGTTAQIRVAGLERAFHGRLRTVSREAAFTPYYALTQYDRGRLSYLAEVDLVEDAARELPTGVPVEVTFETSTNLADAEGVGADAKGAGGEP